MAEIATTCPFCSCGCGLYLHVRENRVTGVSPSRTHPVGQGRLCLKGWHAHELTDNPARLTSPLVRRPEGLRPASWEDALAEVARGLRARMAEGGSESIGVLGSARCANEDNYVLARFARAVLGTPNLDFSLRTGDPLGEGPARRSGAGRPDRAAGQRSERGAPHGRRAHLPRPPAWRAPPRAGHAPSRPLPARRRVPADGARSGGEGPCRRAGGDGGGGGCLPPGGHHPRGRAALRSPAHLCRLLGLAARTRPGARPDATRVGGADGRPRRVRAGAPAAEQLPRGAGHGRAARRAARPGPRSATTWPPPGWPRCGEPTSPARRGSAPGRCWTRSRRST